MRLGGLILTGGRSQRMGRAKESLAIAGTTMLAHQCATLLQCASPVLVIRRDAEQELPDLPESVHVVDDDAPGSGPLAAIATGLRHLQVQCAFGPRDGTFVTGCDLPFLRAADIRWLQEQLGDHEVVMPRTNGLLQPLASILRLSMLPRARQLLDDDVHTPRSLVEGSHGRVLTEEIVREHDPELRFLANVNEPADYEAARRALD